MRLVTFRDRSGRPRPGELVDDRVRPLPGASLVEWLAGGREPAVEEGLAAEDVEILAPVPEPPTLRDFFAYEGHVAAGWRLRGGDVPTHWYEAPVFYFSNPASIHGPREPVRRPEATRMLDFELEIAAVIGGDGDIAGFTLMNDWSARDVQASEMTVGLGPHKGKDFATSLGPWLATPDELPYRDGRLDLEASVAVNGRELSRSNAVEQHWSWPEMIAHAARDTRLRPGDVLGSGTLNRGCLLELGPIEDGRYLEPGDVVAMTAPGLGTLESRVV